MIHRILGGAIGLYHVVPPDEAHVRVLFNSREIFMNRPYQKQKDTRPGYWTIPFVTELTKLPLTNIRIDVPDIKLNDSNMAKFVCDVVCFVNILDPVLAAERTGITTEDIRYEGRRKGIESLSRDFQAIMESIGRTVSTKQTILDIYKDRGMLDEAVSAEVKKVFPQWGLELVDLEIKDIKDAPESSIIADIEKKQAAVISAEARIKIAEQNTAATLVEAAKEREAEVAKAEAQEIYRKRQIAKDQAVAVAEQERVKMEEQKRLEANEQTIEARRKLEVGTADVEREAIIKTAEAERERLKTVAEGKAQEIELQGTAEANIIKAKKVADAEGTEKLAVAQQKFNDAATNIELIKATKDVQIEYAKAQQKAYERATINIMAGSTEEVMSGGVFGKVSVGAKEGVSIQQFSELNPALAELFKKFLAANAAGEKPKK